MTACEEDFKDVCLLATVHVFRLNAVFMVLLSLFVTNSRHFTRNPPNCISNCARS